jgi:hypothetical protein
LFGCCLLGDCGLGQALFHLNSFQVYTHQQIEGFPDIILFKAFFAQTIGSDINLGSVLPR